MSHANSREKWIVIAAALLAVVVAFFLVEGRGTTHPEFGRIYQTNYEQKAKGETKKPAREHAGGLTYIPEKLPEVPWSIHVVKIDRSRHDLQFEKTLSGGNRSEERRVGKECRSRW